MENLPCSDEPEVTSMKYERDNIIERDDGTNKGILPRRDGGGVR